MIKLGCTGKDIITGFTGTITAHVKYLTGCDQYLLTPPVDKEGNHVEARWYDANRISQVGDDCLIIETEADKGPCDQPPAY